MRTLILILICAACATLAVMECGNRKDRRAVAVHAAIGVFIGWVIFRLLAHAGLFERS